MLDWASTFLLVASLFTLTNTELQPCFNNPLCKCFNSVNPSHAECASTIVPLNYIPQFDNQTLSRLKSLSVSGGIIRRLCDVDFQIYSNLHSLTVSRCNVLIIDNHAFSSMTQLVSLDLSTNSISRFPSSIPSSIRWLNLRDNDITEIDVCKPLNLLLSLFLNSNNIMSIPNNFSMQFPNLQFIEISNNRLIKLPNATVIASSIVTIDLSGNFLETIPVNFLKSLYRLQWLKLANNRLRTISDIINGISFATNIIRSIDVSNNYIRRIEHIQLNDSFECDFLELSFNKISFLDGKTFKLFSVKRLDLSGNFINNFKLETFDYTKDNVVEILLSYCGLVVFPPAIMVLRQLSVLNLQGNNLNILQHYDLYIFRFSLIELDLSRNQFSNIPVNALQHLTRLRNLNMSRNSITVLSKNDFLNYSASLHVLDLSHNYMLVLINNGLFAFLKHLKFLDVSFTITNELIEIPFLKNFRCENCQMNKISHHIVKHLQILHLPGNNIQQILIDATFPELINVNLANNPLKEMTLTQYFVPNLINVVINSSKLKAVLSYQFDGLNLTRKISLSGGCIRAIHTLAFNNLPQLEEMLLSNNAIETINLKAFNNLDQIKVIDLSYNNLQFFSWNSINSHASDINLNVSHNLIEHFESSVKNDLHISTLDISYNYLASIHARMFTPIAKFLINLLIKANRVEHLSSGNLQNCYNLFVLDFSNNLLTTISKDFLRNLTRLQYLDLSFNSLNFIEIGTFRNTNIKTLRLKNNKLKAVDCRLFKHLTLISLDLSNNHLDDNCLCALRSQSKSLREVELSKNYIKLTPKNVGLQLEKVEYLSLENNIIVDSIFLELKHFKELIILIINNNPMKITGEKTQYEMFNHLGHLSLNRCFKDSSTNYSFLNSIPCLQSLQLSGNFIKTGHFDELYCLKDIDLSHNHIVSLTSLTFPLKLQTLNISNNPIHVMDSESFAHFWYLAKLDVSELASLRYLDSRFLSNLRYLQSLKTSLYEGLRSHSLQLYDFVAPLNDSLRQLSIVVEPQFKILAHSLQHTLGSKLLELQISGTVLESISVDAFLGSDFQTSKDFHLYLDAPLKDEKLSFLSSLGHLNRVTFVHLLQDHLRKKKAVVEINNRNIGTIFYSFPMIEIEKYLFGK